MHANEKLQESISFCLNWIHKLLSLYVYFMGYKKHFVNYDKDLKATFQIFDKKFVEDAIIGESGGG